jgi:hypothetical protein
MALLEVTQVEQLPELKGGFIFNTREFQSLKTGEHLNFVLKEKDIVVARTWFNIHDTIAISGYKATFGSIDFNVDFSTDSMKYFMSHVLFELKVNGINEVIIKHWPEIYFPEPDQIMFVEQGFQLLEKNVNQHLLVTGDDFILRIKKNEKKKLAQAVNKGYHFRILDSKDLQQTYKLIEETRHRKNYPVSMSYQDLYNSLETMPDKYLLFGLFDGDRLIAGAVSIRVSDNILYNFYHADDYSYRSTSPLVMLVGKIYEYCQDNDIGILDLGISSENGILNEGLFNFKRNLGCEMSDKNTYHLINE